MKIQALAIPAGLLATLFAAPIIRADVEEVLSPYLQIEHPRGEFCERLIKLEPPPGAKWRGLEVENIRLRVPEGAEVDQHLEGSRLLRVVLSESNHRPRASFRIDAFAPNPGDVEAVDEDYARDFAAQYPQKAFEGKFMTSDSGEVVRDKKTAFAMVGGSFQQRALSMHRLQWAYLSRERQFFLTFDCAESEWPDYEDQVGQMLLSLEIARAKSK